MEISTKISLKFNLLTLHFKFIFSSYVYVYLKTAFKLSINIVVTLKAFQNTHYFKFKLKSLKIFISTPGGPLKTQEKVN
jgi:hypothetical protein